MLGARVGEYSSSIPAVYIFVQVPCNGGGGTILIFVKLDPLPDKLPARRESKARAERGRGVSFLWQAGLSSCGPPCRVFSQPVTEKLHPTPLAPSLTVFIPFSTPREVSSADDHSGTNTTDPPPCGIEREQQPRSVTPDEASASWSVRLVERVDYPGCDMIPTLGSARLGNESLMVRTVSSPRYRSSDTF